MPDSAVVETRHLVKTFGSAEVLRGLDLQVDAGSIHAFLGRNGAGKTTAIKILLGMARATSGEARLFGLDCGDPRQSVAARARTGFVSEEKDLYGDLTVDELIRLTQRFYPAWRKDLEQRYRSRFGLSGSVQVSKLSRGTRTRLALLLVFCRSTELLILDEPTSGLDPAATEEVLQAIVSHVAAEGLTVFFSSHQIVEVEQIADSLTILSEGRNFVSGALDAVQDRWRRIHLTFDSAAPEVALRAPGLVHTLRNGRTLTLLSNAGSEQVIQEARALLQPVAVDVSPLSLKEIFLYSTQEGR